MNDILPGVMELLELRVMLASREIRRWRIANADRIAAAESAEEIHKVMKEALDIITSSIEMIERVTKRQH